MIELNEEWAARWSVSMDEAAAIHGRIQVAQAEHDSRRADEEALADVEKEEPPTFVVEVADAADVAAAEDAIADLPQETPEERAPAEVAEPVAEPAAAADEAAADDAILL